MDHHQALDLTIRHFKISAKALATQSGVQEHQISLFRNGKRDVTTKTFFSILEALPPEAQTFFFNQLNLRVSTVEVDSMNSDQLSELLSKIANSVKKPSNASNALVSV